MTQLYTKRGFSNGNRKPGNVEFAFGMKRDVALHLTGSAVLRGDFFVGITLRKDRGRLYGFESKNVKALEALCHRGFEACGVSKVQNWVYRGSTIKYEEIGPDASVGGFLVQSARLPFFSDDVSSQRFNFEAVTFGPGFVEFTIPEELRAPHHGGRQAKFKPVSRVDQASELLEAASIEHIIGDLNRTRCLVVSDD